MVQVQKGANGEEGQVLDVGGWESRRKKGLSFYAQGPLAESQDSEPAGRPHERAQRCARGGPCEHAHGQRGAGAVAGIVPHYHVRHARACGESQ